MRLRVVRAAPDRASDKGSLRRQSRGRESASEAPRGRAALLTSGPLPRQLPPPPRRGFALPEDLPVVLGRACPAA